MPCRYEVNRGGCPGWSAEQPTPLWPLKTNTINSLISTPKRVEVGVLVQRQLKWDIKSKWSSIWSSETPFHELQLRPKIKRHKQWTFQQRMVVMSDCRRTGAAVVITRFPFLTASFEWLTDRGRRLRYGEWSIYRPLARFCTIGAKDISFSLYACLASLLKAATAARKVEQQQSSCKNATKHEKKNYVFTKKNTKSKIRVWFTELQIKWTNVPICGGQKEQLVSDTARNKRKGETEPYNLLPRNVIINGQIVQVSRGPLFHISAGSWIRRIKALRGVYDRMVVIAI